MPWSTQSGWVCHGMVSDGAKALIKLAIEGIGCVSVPDLFHAMRSLGKPVVGARWMANNFQRTSSAVEGHNGYLTRLQHSGRGLSALIYIHNFPLTRPDGTTAAQRLFDHEFPDLFEWVVEHMGDLPLARQSKKIQQVNPFHLEGFPA